MVAARSEVVVVVEVFVVREVVVRGQIVVVVQVLVVQVLLEGEGVVGLGEVGGIGLAVADQLVLEGLAALVATEQAAPVADAVALDLGAAVITDRLVQGPGRLLSGSRVAQVARGGGQRKRRCSRPK